MSTTLQLGVTRDERAVLSAMVWRIRVPFTGIGRLPAETTEAHIAKAEQAALNPLGGWMWADAGDDEIGMACAFAERAASMDGFTAFNVAQPPKGRYFAILPNACPLDGVDSPDRSRPHPVRCDPGPLAAAPADTAGQGGARGGTA